MTKYIGLISLFLVLLPITKSASAAQIETIPTVDPSKRRTSQPPARRGPATVKIIEKTKTEKVFTLTVATEPGAMVVLTPVSPRIAKRLQKEANADGTAVFERPIAGTYKIEVTKPDYETKKEEIKVLPQKSDARRMDLKPITYKLNLKTSITGGSIRYARREEGAAGSMGSPGMITGNYCVLVIKPNGEALINDLRRGEYDIEIRPDSPEFEAKRISVSVPGDVVSNDPNNVEVKTIPVELANKTSKETFSANAWSDADWTRPSGWKVDKGMKVKNVEGVALPANERFRYYLSFELIANVKLNDDSPAGFALRAKDDKNYYLLLIAGPKSVDAPNTARLYIVKDGVKKYVSSLPISVFSTAISSDKGFQIRISGDRSSFALLIEDTDGNLHQAGQFQDDLNTFQIGAVGIAALEKPDFEIRQFQVCSPKCQQ